MDENRIKMVIKEETENIDLIQTFLEKIIKWVKLPYYISWFLFAEMLFFGHYILLIITSTSDTYLILNLLLSIVFAWFIIEIIWTCKQFERFFPVLKNIIDLEEEEIREWYIKRLKVIFNFKRMMITGVVSLIIFGIVIFKFVNYGYWLESKIVLYYDYVFLGITIVAGGMSQYSFYSLSVFIFRLAKLPFKKIIYTYATTRLTSIGRLLLKIGAGGIALIMVATLMIYLGPFEEHTYLYFLLLIFLIGAIFWFFITQYKIHQILLQRKNSRIDAISICLEKAIEEAVSNPTSEKIQKVNELKGLFIEIHSMPVWPFDLKTLFSFLATVIIPIIIIILQLILRQE